MYYIYLGERSSSATYVFVSNTLSSLYLNSCHAYLQAGIGPYVGKRIATNSWIRGSTEQGGLIVLTEFFAFHLTCSVQLFRFCAIKQHIRHRLSSDNCSGNFFLLVPQNSSYFWFAQAVHPAVSGQSLWTDPCPPVCLPIHSSPSLHPHYSSFPPFSLGW